MADLTIEDRRAVDLRAILTSNDRHKLIVAGPGTGKTYTFGEILRRSGGGSLIITFLKNLVRDMKNDLGGLADVRTFHSFARKTLHRNPYGGIDAGFTFFPKLGHIVASDVQILEECGLPRSSYSLNEFEEAFRSLIEEDGRIDLFISRANYYNAVGFDDSVYRVLLKFRDHPDSIPHYGAVMVDEYQDFNPLEVGIITCLESMNRTVIVGDDDQAIYDFRNASPDFIREKTKDQRYRTFPLRFCSRCTEVVISGVHSIIRSAQASNILGPRIEKDFYCYLPSKHEDNQAYPRIVKALCSVQSKRAPYIARYIEHVVTAIPANDITEAVEEGYPLVLIVGPSHYLDQIFGYLNSIFPNVEYPKRERLELALVDGYRLLLKCRDSELAWRIILEFSGDEQLNELVCQSYDPEFSIHEGLSDEFKSSHLDRLDSLKAYQEDASSIEEGEIVRLQEQFGTSIESVIDQLFGTEEADNDIEGAKILLTTYSGCKGLSAGYVFITGLEDGVFPRSNHEPQFTEVCQLIVSLTRTRKQCHMVSTGRFAGERCRRSVFLSWIEQGLSETTVVDENYFK